MQKLISSTSLAAMAFAMTSASVATAQEPTEVARRDDRDRIVVTARKREETADTVPMSITAVSGERLVELGVTDNVSLTRVIPGFVAANTYFGSPVYYLRGVGFYDTAMAARPAVSLYWDETPIPFAVMALGTTLDLERVEVLKGPQGTLFGSNATGGAINFVAAGPTDDFAAGADFSYGRFNETIVGGYVSGPITDTFGGRVAISRRTADEWQQSYTSDATNGAVDITSARVTLDWNPTTPLDLRFTLGGTHDQSDTIAPQLIGKVPMTLTQPEFDNFPLAPLDDARAAGFSSTFPSATTVDGNSLQRDDWVWQASLRADYELSQDVLLTSITSYARAGQGHGYEADGTSFAVKIGRASCRERV